MTKALHELLTPAEADFIATLNDKLTGFVKRGSFDPPSQQANAAGLTQTASNAARNGQDSNAHGRDDRDAIAARQSLIGHINLDAPSNLPHSDDHITGKVGGKEKIKPALAWVDPEIGLERQKGVAILQPTTLFIPCARPMRIANGYNVTTFHFSHEAISRSADVAADNAAEHSRYLEREGAIAIAPISAGIAAAQGHYIERDSAQARSENGEPVLFSNIASDFAGRKQFWTQVEAHERKPGNDKITLHPIRNRTLWDEVLNDPDCPSSFKKNYEAFHKQKGAKSKAQSFATGAPGTNKKIAAVLRKYNTDQSAWGCAFSDARGGRIQMRIGGELPNDISHDGRVRIVRAFAQEFEKRSLPFQAVMHAPDHRNDEKNWHFHVAYHDRPAKLFTGDLDDLIPPANLTVATKAIHAIAVEALTVKKVRDQIKQWDFTVAYTRRDEKSRHFKTTYPFAQAKVRECNKSDFPKKLRVRLAELINDELAGAGVLRRVSAETYVKIGIEKTPDQHLGPARNELEKMGVATSRGVENERNNWQFRVDQAIAKRNQDFDDCQSRLGHFRDDLKRYTDEFPAPAFTANQLALHAAACDQYAHLRAEQRRLEFVSFIADQTSKRAKSRAEKLRKDMTKILTAIKNGKASERDVDNEAAYETRLRDAEYHLRLVDHEFAPINERATEFRSASDALTQQIAELDGRLRSAGFVFCRENQLDRAELGLQARFAALGQKYTPSAPPRELSSVDDLGVREAHIQCTEWQIEADEAAVAEQAARKVKEAPSPTVSPNTTPAQSAITGEHPNAVKPGTLAPTPPFAQRRPVPTQHSDVPLDMPDAPQNKEAPVATEATAKPATGPASSPMEPAQGIPPKRTLENRMASVVKLASENLNKNADPLPQHPKPIPTPPPNLERLKADALNRVALPQPEPAPESAPTPVSEPNPETPPQSITPTKVDSPPYAEFGARVLGNRSAMYSDPTTNPNRQPVQPVAHDAVQQTAAPDIIDPMDYEWAKAVDRQLSKARQGEAHLLHIHPSVLNWFVARRDNNSKAQMEAALALARDRDVYDLILKIPNDGVIPEDFGHIDGRSSSSASSPKTQQHGLGNNLARAAQYDRGRDIGNE